MSKDACNSNNKKSIWDKIVDIVTIISLIFAMFFCTTYKQVIAGFGSIKLQISLADEARQNCDVSTALKYYKKIVDGDTKYAPYAALACAEIYSENEIYDNSFDYFKIAMNSQEKMIIDSCMNYLLQQSELIKTGKDKRAHMDLFSNEKLPVITDFLNNVNGWYPQVFENTGLEFPLSSEDVENCFLKETMVVSTKKKWEYVSTRYSNNGSEAFVEEDSKLVLVDSYQELVDSTSFSTETVYKYYRYKSVVISETPVMLVDVISENAPKSGPIYLGNLILN